MDNFEFKSPSVQFFSLVKKNKIQDAINLAKRVGIEQINVNQ
jgi:hypothetical protein